MPDCRKFGQYAPERELQSKECVELSGGSWSEELMAVWQKKKDNLVAVSGQMDTGGGVVLNRSLLPHLQLAGNEGFVLTAAHIVDKKKSILVGRYDKGGTMADMDRARLVALDRSRDLALLKVRFSPGTSSAGIETSDLGHADAGSKALAVLTEDTSRCPGIFQVVGESSYGKLGGAAIRKHFPIVSMIDRTGIVVLDTADSPGTSGSPVIGADGKILGLVSQRLPRISGGAVALDGDRQPQWVKTAAVSSGEIFAFLSDIDGKKAARRSLEP